MLRLRAANELFDDAFISLNTAREVWQRAMK